MSQDSRQTCACPPNACHGGHTIDVGPVTVGGPLEIAVYGKPGCGQCTATTRHLTRLGLPYAYRDVTQDPLWSDTVTALGYRSLPVVTIGDMHWSGYRHERLQRLGQIHADAPDVAALEPAATTYLLAEDER